MGSTERWVLVVLALFRLTWTVMNDDGAFDLLTRAREALGVYDLAENGQPTSVLGRFLSCAYCVSRVIALLGVVLVLKPTFVGDLFLLWYGLAGALALLIRWRQWT